MQRLGDELAVLVVVLDPLGEHAEFDATDDVLATVGLVTEELVDDRVGVDEDVLDVIGVEHAVLVGILRDGRVGIEGVVLQWWAVPVGVCEQLSRLAEVEDGEEELLVVRPQPCAPDR